MGKKSTKENKTIYQLCREENGMTRAAASDIMDYISADRIEKIESEKSLPHPDEVLAMSSAYKNPSLCNYFCSHECPIGQRYVPSVEVKTLPQITLETLASLNSVEKQKNRLIEITADGNITSSEIEDFLQIQHELEQISLAVESLQLWFEKHAEEHQLDTSIFKSTQLK